MIPTRRLLLRLSAFLGGALVLLPPLLALADPRPETGAGLPRDVSVHGHHIDWLIQITMVFTAILFVIMVAWMLIAVRKHAAGKHEAEYDHGDSKHSVKTALALSAVIFFVVDGNLWVDSTMDVNARFWNHAWAEEHDPVRIEVNAHQWVWDARYAGEDGEFNTPDDVLTQNDIRVPVGTPIILQLASVDVIHSFYLPNFRVKQDATPGMINRLWFQAKKTGEFDIACAQHCGTHHYKMKGLLTVLTKREFSAWLAEAATISGRAFDPRDEHAHWGWAWRDL